MRQINVGLAGLGQIGGAVYQNLSERYECIKKRHGLDIRIIRIAEKDKAVFKNKTAKHKTFTPKSSTLKELARDPKIDIVIELIGGYDLAAEFILDAIKHKKHIVTANKAALAKHGENIFSKAANMVNIGYEASVGGFVPFLSTLDQRYSIEKIKSVIAINNGSTNKMLTEMFQRETFDFKSLTDEFIKEGILEADPSLDIEGIDSMHKLILTARRAFRTKIDINNENLYREGLSRITADDIWYAQEFGQVIKLLSIAIRDTDTIQLRVHPTMIPHNHPFARIDDTINYFRIQADLSMETGIEGRGAGPGPTSSVIIDDVIKIAKNPKMIQTQNPDNYANNYTIEPIGSLTGPYYMRCTVVDQPGVLSQISGIIGICGLNISPEVKQFSNGEGLPAHIVMMLGQNSKELNVKRAVKEIEKLDCNLGRPFYIRMMYQHELTEEQQIIVSEPDSDKCTKNKIPKKLVHT